MEKQMQTVGLLLELGRLLDFLMSLVEDLT